MPDPIDGSALPIRRCEEEFFDSTHECPDWFKVNFARELLRIELEEIQRFRSGRGEDGEMVIEDLRPNQARELAIFHLAGLATRAIGSCIALISCGYVPEAKASVRRLREAVLRTYAIRDDESGEHARAWLSGRPLRGLTALESRYGGQLMKQLSVPAHADVTGLFALQFRDQEKTGIDLAPQRNEVVVKALFLMVTAQILLLLATVIDIHDNYMASQGTCLKIDALQRDLGVQVFTSCRSPHIQVSPTEYLPISPHDFSSWSD